MIIFVGIIKQEFSIKYYLVMGKLKKRYSGQKREPSKVYFDSL